jgi:hypothetical protein
LGKHGGGKSFANERGTVELRPPTASRQIAQAHWIEDQLFLPYI